MGGDALTGVEKLNRLIGQAGVDLLPAERMGYRVEMFFHLHVIINAYQSSPTPIRVLVSLRG